MNGRTKVRTRSRALLVAIASIAAAIVIVGSSKTGAAQTASERAITDRYLTTVRAQLDGKVDTRSAKTGQEVALRITEDARLADGTSLPKGSRLLGRVTAAQAQDSDRPGSLLVLTFDRAEVKGQMLNVRSVLQMVTPAPGLKAPMNDSSRRMDQSPFSDSPDTGMGSSSAGGISDSGRGIGTRSSIDPSGNGSRTGTLGTASTQSPVSMTGAQGSVYGGSDSGINGPILGPSSGPMNGSQNGSISGSSNRPVDVPSLSGRSITNPSGDLASIPTTGNTRIRPVVGAGENISGAARPTGMPGVMLSRNGAPDASGVLTGMGRNIVLDSGTRLTLGVIAR